MTIEIAALGFASLAMTSGRSLKSLARSFDPFDYAQGKLRCAALKMTVGGRRRKLCSRQEPQILTAQIMLTAHPK
jgi:hypothetical protein